MKQHITGEQLNELGERGKERYWKYCCENLGAKSRKEVFSNIAGKDVRYKNLPLLSIGQMIEFLGEKEPPDWTTALFSPFGKLDDEYTVEGPVRLEKLCDALWYWTKEKLEGRGLMECLICRDRVEVGSSEYWLWCGRHGKGGSLHGLIDLLLRKVGIKK